MLILSLWAAQWPQHLLALMILLSGPSGSAKYQFVTVHSFLLLQTTIERDGPDVSQLPLGHQCQIPATNQPDTPDPAPSNGSAVLALLDTAQLALERARRRVVIFSSRLSSEAAAICS